MCRLFAYRGPDPYRAERALTTEPNSLLRQSHRNPDGWGIASYLGDRFEPTVWHSVRPAYQDPRFKVESHALSSETTIAHVREATVGDVDPDNSHPFTYGKWSFVHNGTLQSFRHHRPEIMELIAPDLRAHIQGDTDSEHCFYVFLTKLREHGGLEAPTMEQVAKAMAETSAILVDITDRDPLQRPTATNFIVSDGEMLLGLRLNRTLYFSDGGAARDQAPKSGEKVKELSLASERLNPNERWLTVPQGAVIGVDGDLSFHQWTSDELLAKPRPTAAA